MKKKEPWQPILYIEQPYKDNYITKKYMKEDIINNKNIIPYDYFTCVNESSVIIQQISILSLFTIIFYYSYLKIISIKNLIIIDLILLLLTKCKIFLKFEKNSHSISYIIL